MYHIVKSKSKERPFQVVNVDGGNGEVINTSQLLKSKQACLKNIIAGMNNVYSDCEKTDKMYVSVQDDTLKTPNAFSLYDDGKKVYRIEAMPRYIPGRNPKKKSK